MRTQARLIGAAALLLIVACLGAYALITGSVGTHTAAIERQTQRFALTKMVTLELTHNRCTEADEPAEFADHGSADKTKCSRLASPPLAV